MDTANQENTTTRRKSRSRARRIVGNVLFALLMIVILGGALLFATSRNPHKSIFGYRFYEALSDSMAPTIKRGDLVIVKLGGPETAKTGDIVTFADDEAGLITVTHRLIEEGVDATGETFIQTQGDANNTPDSPVDGQQMIGVVVGRVPFAGTAVHFLRNHGWFVLIVVAVVIAASYIIHSVHKRDSTAQ